MNIIDFGSDKKIFENNSKVRLRKIEYGKLFDFLDILIFSRRSNGTQKTDNISLNVNAYSISYKNIFKIFYNSLKKISEIIKKNNGKTIISTQDPFESGFVGLCTKIFYGIPLHIQLHTDFINKNFIFSSILNFIRFILGHITIPFADSVRVVSLRSKNNISDLNDEIDILPIYTEIEDKINFVRNFEQKDKLVFITVARLEQEKDIETSIYAFKKFIDNGRKGFFNIVGDGSLKDKLVYLVKKLNLEGKVNFLGWQNDTSKFFEEADIYICNSIFEGYGMSLIEAGAYGLPIISTNVGIVGDIFIQHSDIYKSSCLVINKNNIEDCSNKMILLSDDLFLRKSLGLNSRESVKNSFHSKEDYLINYKKNIEKSLDTKISKYFLKRLLDFLFAVLNHNKILRFILVGGFVALTQIYLLYFLTEAIGFWYLMSSILSFIYACIASFVLQKYWAFRDKNKKNIISQFIKFIIVALIGISINTGSMYLWVEIIGIWYVLAQFITGFIVAIINFMIYKFFIFKKI